MAISFNSALIAEKRQLMLEEEQATPEEADAIRERIGILESQIRAEALKRIKKDANTGVEAQQTPPKKQYYTGKELRAMTNEKFTVYQRLAKEAFALYNDLVAKKREKRTILTLISEKNDDAVREALKY